MVAATGTDLKEGGPDGFAGLGDLAECKGLGPAAVLVVGSGDGSEDGATKLFTGVAGVRPNAFPNFVNEDEGALGVGGKSLPSPLCAPAERVERGGRAGAPGFNPEEPPTPEGPESVGEDKDLPPSLSDMGGREFGGGRVSVGVAMECSNLASSLESCLILLFSAGAGSVLTATSRPGIRDLSRPNVWLQLGPYGNSVGLSSPCVRGP